MPGTIALPEGEAYTAIEDTYLPDTGLRLRAMRAPHGAVVFKLCKKYGKSSAPTEAMTNLYLTEAEHALLRSSLTGAVIRKRRYAVEGGSVDVYPDRGDWTVFEREFISESDARAYVPPDFVGREITGDPDFSGAALAYRPRASA